MFGLGGGANGNVLIENETGAAVVGSGTNSFTNVGTLTVASGSTLTLTADLVTNTGGAITGNGTLDLTAPAARLTRSIMVSSTISAARSRSLAAAI